MDQAESTMTSLVILNQTALNTQQEIQSAQKRLYEAWPEPRSKKEIEISDILFRAERAMARLADQALAIHKELYSSYTNTIRRIPDETDKR